MIAVLTPTRGRPENVRRMIASARDSAADPEQIEIWLYFDDDDPSRYGDYGAEVVVGPRDGVGRAWNQLARKTNAELLMMGNDDLVFHTVGWDRAAEEVLTLYPDGIFCAWFNDGSPKAAERCAFPIVSSIWVDALGYFTPQCFNFLYHDTWIADVGRRVGRLHYMPDILVEHRHFAFGKAEYDDTYRAHREGQGDKRKEDGAMFEQTAPERQNDADKLKALVHG